ncbi:MAG: DUF924 family protein [Caldilineaceae bacterium]
MTALLPIERQFLYMPLMHAEDVAAQQECLRLHTLAEEVGPAQEMAIAAIPFAEQHLEIIRRFGRFPHRNVALGRTSTPDEAAFMADGGPPSGRSRSRFSKSRRKWVHDFTSGKSAEFSPWYLRCNELAGCGLDHAALADIEASCLSMWLLSNGLSAYGKPFRICRSRTSTSTGTGWRMTW